MENKHFKIPLPLLEASGSGHGSRADGSVQERAIFVTHPTCWHSLILSTGSHGIYFRIGTTGAWVFTSGSGESEAQWIRGWLVSESHEDRGARDVSTSIIDRSNDPTNERTWTCLILASSGRFSILSTLFEFVRVRFKICRSFGREKWFM